MRIGTAALALAVALPASTASGAPPASTPPVIKWEQADDHVGEEVTVDGRVLGVHCSPTSCLLAFDPTFNKFTAVIQARDFEDLPPDDLDRLYSGRRVRVHGKITKREGKPEIVVEGKEDLALVHAERRAQREAERALKVQTDVLERLTAVLERVEALTERMAATQERMDTLLANLEQRDTALAAAQAASAAAATPPEPSYGEPQPRPGFEALRTVKRGMSRNDVQRLIGQPQYVESTGRGWTTWYYGYGRSISFDARGRAQSLVGFPAP